MITLAAHETRGDSRSHGRAPDEEFAAHHFTRFTIISYLYPITKQQQQENHRARQQSTLKGGIADSFTPGKPAIN
jgi:hypothetical protein